MQASIKYLLLLLFMYVSHCQIYAQKGEGSISTEELSLIEKQRYTKLMQASTNEALYAKYDVSFYWLNLHMERDTTAIDGYVEIRGKSLVNGMDTLVLELIQELNVTAVKWAGNPVQFARSGDNLYVLPPTPLNSGQTFVLRVYYNGAPPSGGFFNGISSATSTQWGNQVTWTLSEPFNARQWWPAKQDLRDKADSVWVFITCDTSSMAGSNGLLKAVVPVAGGKHRFEWKSYYPIAYYLISAAVADFQEYSIYAKPAGMADSILIQNFIYDAPTCLDFYKIDLDRTKQFVELYSELFGPYPFAAEKYGHCQVHLGGGMEHQTMSTVGAFNFDLNCHELSHQWFGDAVTCATWSDIWLNEGFATYAQYLCMQYMIGLTEANNFMGAMHSIVKSEPGGSVYIPPADATSEGRIFDGRLSYNKGAVILHILRFEMNNDTLFFNTLKAFVNQYNGTTATGDDFRAVAETISGLNLSTFFQQWYYGEGYPIYDIHWLYSGDTLYLTSAQSASTTVTPFFKMSTDFKLLYNGGDTTIRLFQDAATKYYKIPVHHEITGIIPNPANWTLLKIDHVVQGIAPVVGPSAFVMFPNPCKDSLRFIFSTPGKSKTLNISDINGKQIDTIFTTNEAYTYDTRRLARGVYLVTNAEDGATVKFVKE